MKKDQVQIIEDGIEYTVTTDGANTIRWYANNQLHRLSGPAVTYPWVQEWYLHGQLHRADGPAIVFVDGKKQYWHYQGKFIEVETQEEFEQWLKLKTFE